MCLLVPVVALMLEVGWAEEQVPNPDSYEVFAQPKEYPDDGPRSIELDPALDGGDASPFGWHDTDGTPGAEFTITRGNNVYAYTDIDANNEPDPGSAPDGGPLLEFIFPLDLGHDPAAYRPASVTNAFYWLNVIHDVLYGYGFDEAAGNFQENNYGAGGIAGDPILIEVQDGSFTNGITVVTPPDGGSPRIQLGLFTLTNPRRDSALSSYALSYAVGRAVTLRLVGGPSTVDCLDTQESTGMSVGWSDWIALVLTADPSETATTSRGVGTYIFGQPPTGSGIRDAPYSTDFVLNPLTYDSIKSLSYPFGTGNVWATMLWQVYWELVGEHGFNPDIYGDWTTGGNNLVLQLVIDGMKLAPCHPGFVDGREAILLADEELTGGENRCAIWRGFAARGLGFGAEQGSAGSLTDGVEAFDLPPECENTGVDGEHTDTGNAAWVSLAAASTPNPVGTTAPIRFSLRRGADVRLSIYDARGREVVTLLDEWTPAGEHVAVWDGARGDGRSAESGVYFVRLRSGDRSAMQKVVFAR